jgi:hypothetical protein
MNASMYAVYSSLIERTVFLLALYLPESTESIFIYIYIYIYFFFLLIFTGVENLIRMYSLIMIVAVNGLWPVLYASHSKRTFSLFLSFLVNCVLLC